MVQWRPFSRLGALLAVISRDGDVDREHGNR